MASLAETIGSDFKQAMKDRNELVLAVLRLLKAALENKKIAKKSRDELNDKQVIGTVKSEIKKRKEATIAYQQGDRQDLADKEKEEIKILEKYLPAQMSQEQIEVVVKEVISSLGEVGPGDFGQVMGAVMGRLKGQADGNAVSQAVKKRLS